MIMKSVEILNTALAYQNAVMLMQSPPPGIDLSNAYATGVHWKTLEKHVPIVKAVMTPMHT